MAKSKLKDLDPEALLDPNPSSSDEEGSAFSDSEQEEDANAGREHYQDVGKSKLRKKEVVPLGPQYTGSRVTRDEIEDEDSDDPFARSYGIEDGEEDDDEDSEDDSIGGVALNGHGAAESSEGEDNEEEEGSFDDEGGMEGIEDEDDGESGSEEDDGDEEEEEDEDETADISDKIRSMMTDTTAMSSAISQAAKADAEKGRAIKTQRKTYDSLLNTRIKLQGGLIATNSMNADTNADAIAPQDAIEAAEAAALTLLNHLTALRESLDSSKAGQKRKRAVFTSSTSDAEIWSAITQTESSAVPHRNTILDKWSTKTRGATITTGKLTGGVAQTITDVLGNQLRDTGRLVERTQVPRSCAPIQAAASVESSPAIYDDADFYSLLLKELLENRSAELNAKGVGEFVVSQPYELMRQAKTKKVVDTKASKGRKMRYTVHEKLQNFMAPEDKNAWGERQREELFSSLFGRKGGLGEDDESDHTDDEDVNAEEEGLTLFRS
ncbi:TRAUB-domain-containing protein [Aaosphaeria arxii CBS 175.79]|uniref:Protein BFR2 n=1 Tax=Aaosphaeria arxii CBS 175.79 TaxID=1450172 RepID=A0A6A5X8T0_9PLEO|nr:TRAUB-domain-containing protein [Aaosphaeria arxii CBS 175.79]KAF2009368.1 TRAUB-domain-containing protein [Aaosphaeria arxii CBS 175.79]